MPVGPAERRRMTDRYLDTDEFDGRLAGALYRARLRRSDRSVELTVKRRGIYQGALSERLELKGGATRSRNPARWPASEARDRLLAVAGTGPLVEIAAIRQQRLIRHFRRGATEVEVSLDALEALVGPRVAARRWELEIELLTGEKSALMDLATALRTVPGVSVSEGSKLDFAKSAQLG